MRFGFILCGLLAVVYLVAGCGGSSGGGTGSTAGGETSAAGAGAGSTGSEEARGSEEAGGGAGSTEAGSEEGEAESEESSAGGEESAAGGESEAGKGEESSSGGGREGGAEAGGKGESSTGGKPLSKAQFIKQGDAICRRGTARALKAVQRAGSKNGGGSGQPSTPKARAERVIGLILPIFSREARELSELVPPPGDEAKAAAIVSALEKGIAKAEANPARAVKGGDPLAESHKLAAKYGFKVCG